MARIKVGSGIKEYTKQLTQLHDLSRETIGVTVYEGTRIVKDAILSEIQALPVAQKYAKNGEKLNTITSVQKKGLLDGFGVARMRDDSGYYNTKIGFEGYNGQKTSKWPQGVPNSVIARSLVTGTSFRQKNDFIGRAVRRTKAQAEEAMKKKLETEISKIMK